MSKKSRILWIDIARGIAMILVIVGHTLYVGDYNSQGELLVRNMIYSVHMPLFFILGGLTFKPSINESQFIFRIKKSFKQLIGLALILFIIRKGLFLLLNLSHIDLLDFIKNGINTFIYSSGVQVSIGDAKIEAIGMLWFLFTLFFLRTIVDYLYLNYTYDKILAYSLILSILGVLFGKVQELPFSLDITLAVIPLFILGYEIKNRKIDIFSKKVLLMASLTWLVLFLLFNNLLAVMLELAIRSYPIYPLSLIMAIAGSGVIIGFAFYLSKFKLANNFLSFVGSNTMWLFAIHALDSNLISLWEVIDNGYIQSSIRVVLDILILWVIIKTTSYVKVSVSQEATSSVTS